MSLLINNLSVKQNQTVILHDINIEIKEGEIHVITGSNGSGKTTLIKTIMGHPDCDIVNGKVILNKTNITNISTIERVGLGLTMSFQNPPKIEGVNVNDISKVLNKLSKNNLDTFQIPLEIRNKTLDTLSSGELKKTDLFLTSKIYFKYILLDEPETSLDLSSIDYLENYATYLKKKGKGILLVTHSEKLIKSVKANYVYALTDHGNLNTI